MSLSQEERDRIYEEERVRRDAQEDLRREKEKAEFPLKLVGWLMIVAALAFIWFKYPEWQRQQREMDEFRQTLDGIVNR